MLVELKRQLSRGGTTSQSRSQIIEDEPSASETEVTSKRRSLTRKLTGSLTHAFRGSFDFLGKHKMSKIEHEGRLEEHTNKQSQSRYICPALDVKMLVGNRPVNDVLAEFISSTHVLELRSDCCLKMFRDLSQESLTRELDLFARLLLVEFCRQILGALSVTAGSENESGGCKLDETKPSAPANTIDVEEVAPCVPHGVLNGSWHGRPALEEEGTDLFDDRFSGELRRLKELTSCVSNESLPEYLASPTRSSSKNHSQHSSGRDQTHVTAGVADDTSTMFAKDATRVTGSAISGSWEERPRMEEPETDSFEAGSLAKGTKPKELTACTSNDDLLDSSDSPARSLRENHSHSLGCENNNAATSIENNTGTIDTKAAPVVPSGALPDSQGECPQQEQTYSRERTFFDRPATTNERRCSPRATPRGEARQLLVDSLDFTARSSSKNHSQHSSGRDQTHVTAGVADDTSTMDAKDATRVTGSAISGSWEERARMEEPETESFDARSLAKGIMQRDLTVCTSNDELLDSPDSHARSPRENHSHSSRCENTDVAPSVEKNVRTIDTEEAPVVPSGALPDSQGECPQQERISRRGRTLSDRPATKNKRRYSPRATPRGEARTDARSSSKNHSQHASGRDQSYAVKGIANDTSITGAKEVSCVPCATLNDSLHDRSQPEEEMEDLDAAFVGKYDRLTDSVACVSNEEFLDSLTSAARSTDKSHSSHSAGSHHTYAVVGVENDTVTNGAKNLSRDPNGAMTDSSGPCAQERITCRTRTSQLAKKNKRRGSPHATLKGEAGHVSFDSRAERSHPRRVSSFHEAPLVGKATSDALPSRNNSNAAEGTKSNQESLNEKEFTSCVPSGALPDSPLAPLPRGEETNDIPEEESMGRHTATAPRSRKNNKRYLSEGSSLNLDACASPRSTFDPSEELVERRGTNCSSDEEPITHMHSFPLRPSPRNQSPSPRNQSPRPPGLMDYRRQYSAASTNAMIPKPKPLSK